VYGPCVRPGRACFDLFARHVAAPGERVSAWYAIKHGERPNEDYEAFRGREPSPRLNLEFIWQILQEFGTTT
jgi:hypothetical protein